MEHISLGLRHVNLMQYLIIHKQLGNPHFNWKTYLDVANWTLPSVCTGCHSLLSQKDDRYNQVRQELYKYYYPLEIDQSIPYDEKVELMKEW